MSTLFFQNSNQQRAGGAAAGNAPTTTTSVAASLSAQTPPSAAVASVPMATSSTTMPPPANRSRAPSDFDLRLMPHDRIVRRNLHPWSVHHSLPTSSWIATICRPDTAGSSDPMSPNGTRLRYVQFSFPTEREARKFCQAYTPPKPVAGGTCKNCNAISTHRHCKNCGVPLCERCSIRWGSRMVPKTYLNSAAFGANGHHHGGGHITVRVCKSCDWLSNAFCLSLLQGRYQDALTIHGTGNVNLRTSFADIHREAMFPIHCAVMGGSLELVKWLVEGQLCPISVNRDEQTNRMLSVQTSANRTLLDLAMTGRPKLDILVYLIQRGLSVDDLKDTSLAPKTLETVLKMGSLSPPVAAAEGGRSPSDDLAGMVEEINLIQYDETTMTTLEDGCKLCCERAIDCVLQPCGHQMCCAECGSQLSLCPICKVHCSVLRVYRP